MQTGNKCRITHIVCKSANKRFTRECPGGEMVDALVSGASAERRAGSSPVPGTLKKRSLNIKIIFSDRELLKQFYPIFQRATP